MESENESLQLTSICITTTLPAGKVGGSVIRRQENGGVIANFHRFGDLDFRFFTVFFIPCPRRLFSSINTESAHAVTLPIFTPPNRS